MLPDAEAAVAVKVGDAVNWPPAPAVMELSRLKSSCKARVPPLATVIAGLKGRLTARVDMAGATVLIEAGVVEVSVYVNCGLDSVNPKAL